MAHLKKSVAQFNQTSMECESMKTKEVDKDKCKINLTLKTLVYRMKLTFGKNKMLRFLHLIDLFTYLFNFFLKRVRLKKSPFQGLNL